MKTLRLTIAIALLSGCATHPDKMATKYTPKHEYHKYASYSCQQMSRELKQMRVRLTELYQTLEEKSVNDTAQMGAGVMFWPSLLFLEGGDGSDALEFKALKGEYNTMRDMAFKRPCRLAAKPLQRVLKEAKEDNTFFLKR